MVNEGVLATLRVGAVIGQGGHAIVRKGSVVDDGVPRAVAVKCPRSELRKAHWLCMQEAEVLQRLNHRHIIRCLGVTSVGSDMRQVVVLEYLDKGSLNSLVGQQMLSWGRLYTMTDATLWCMQLARALSYLHKNNIIHRDVKLDNVMLASTAEGVIAKLVDFGVCCTIPGKLDGTCVVDAPTSADRDGPRCASPFGQGSPGQAKSTARSAGRTGSLLYMAPEMYLGQAYDEKMDIFSLGVLMHELYSSFLLIAAAAPHGVASEVELHARAVAFGHRPAFPPHFPPAAIGLVNDCWASDPFARPSADEVYHRLQQLLHAFEEPDAESVCSSDSGGASEARFATKCCCVIS